MLVILLSTGSTLLTVLRTVILVSLKPTTGVQCLAFFFGIWSSQVQALGPKKHVVTTVIRFFCSPTKKILKSYIRQAATSPASNFEILFSKSC
jgi:hypothetical protein